MQQEAPPYKRGQWVFRATVIGSFLGLLFDKFAIGLIFGFFVGIFIDSSKRKAAEAESKPRSPEEERPGP